MLRWRIAVLIASAIAISADAGDGAGFCDAGGGALEILIGVDGLRFEGTESLVIEDFPPLRRNFAAFVAVAVSFHVVGAARAGRE